jgi:hypothetical protein
MPKNKVSEWSATAANNTDIGSIDIAEGCAPSGINNAIRELMAQVKDMQSGTDADNFTVGGNLYVTGTSTLTGAVTAPAGITANVTGNLTGNASTATNIAGGGAGQVPYNSGADTTAFLAAGTTGQYLQSNGTSAPAWATLNYLTSGTAQASTSGTSIDFTGIPSWVKRITVMLSGVSTNGTSPYQIQLGDSGGFETTGYSGSAVTPATDFTYNSSGLALSGVIVAASINQGVVTILNISGNTWVSSGVLASNASGYFGTSSGAKTLSATLDRIRIATVNGTDTFDAGTINIMYE